MNARIILVVLIALLGNLRADAFYGEMEIEGINYDVVTKTKSATVIAPSEGKYAGNIVIPQTIVVDDVECTVTGIGKEVFKGCDVVSVTIPTSVTSIGDEAFADCKSLDIVYISDLLSWCRLSLWSAFNNTPHRLFLDGEEIRNLIIPEGSLTAIQKGPFNNCISVKSVSIPETVTTIGAYAFEGCTGLTSFCIPNNVTSIGDYAFQGCTGLTSFTFSERTTDWGKYILKGCSQLSSVTIPEGVEQISEGAFSGCSGLETIDIPPSVSMIQKSAFENCGNLTSVVIAGDTYVSYLAFSSCWRIKTFNLGKSKRFHSVAFKYCYDLMDVYCQANTVPEIDYYVKGSPSDFFSACYIRYATLHVPDSLVEQYKSTEPWSEFGRIVALTGDGPKCASPTITYEDEMLKFHCDTENATFVSIIEDSDIGRYKADHVNLGATYTVRVYACSEGHSNSDIVCGKLCWTDSAPHIEYIVRDGVKGIQAAPQPAIVQRRGQYLNISGVTAGTLISVYDLHGRLVTSSIAGHGQMMLNVGAQRRALIVKVGESGLKVAGQ